MILVVMYVLLAYHTLSWRIRFLALRLLPCLNIREMLLSSLDRETFQDPVTYALLCSAFTLRLLFLAGTNFGVLGGLWI